jgi:CheY-like chemotaxis protein
VGRLAAGLAHDVNNALGVIMGHASLMRENYASPSLDAILQATRAAASTTHQLLAYGRQTVLRPTLLDLSDLVLESRHLFERVLEANVQFDVVVDRTCGCVRLDRGQVQQVLLNLILNARDAMPEGGRIEVEVLPAETERGPWVVLEVRDQGAGMDETVQARIFDPFFTTKGPGAGSGLGLAMVAGIVSQSGGEVRVESRPGAGSTFRLLFPVASTEPADAIAKQLPADRPAGPLRIVLVDDDEGVSDLLERVLRSAGHEVKTFRHPERALVDCVAGQRWDVLVTDAVMPGMDGPTLADALRLRFPGLRVLFISGYAPARWGDRFSGKGSGFLGKPFGPKELLAAVEALVADTSSGAGA